MEIRILLCLLAAAPLLLTPWVHGDGIGYFSYLHSVIIDGDLDLANEAEYLSAHVREDAGGIPGRLLDESDHRPGYRPSQDCLIPSQRPGRHRRHGSRRPQSL